MDLNSKIVQANSPNTPTKVLEQLATDKSSDIRYYATINPNYKKSVNLDLSQSQLTALKNLIEASSNPHLQELFNGIS